MTTRAWRASLCLVGFIVGCSSEPLAQVGDACSAPDDCESGRCELGLIGNRCTTECSDADPCPVTSFGGRLVCNTAGLCDAPCSEGTASGDGESTQICVGGVLRACSERDPVADCDICGCDPFGGGVCVEGLGCVVPRPDGESCTLDAECLSGACYRDSHVCGAPRVTGEPCRVDAECESSNCSTDGDESIVGHCNQPLGSECTAPSVGRNVTETCNRCEIRFGNSRGVCLRSNCDPVDANHCASFSGHEFRCDRSTEGTYHCFERCEDDFDDCYYDTLSCYQAGDYCR